MRSSSSTTTSGSLRCCRSDRSQFNTNDGKSRSARRPGFLFLRKCGAASRVSERNGPPAAEPTPGQLRFLDGRTRFRKRRANMPLLQYFFGVGGALLCLMFALNAYVPKDPPREQHELDKSTIRITAPRTGDYVVDHFPLVRNDLTVDPEEAVRRALAMMPKEDQPKQHVATARSASQSPAPPRKRRIAQRAQPRQPNGEAAYGRPQAWASNGWSNNSWSQNWSQNSSQYSANGSSGGWSSNWNNGYSRNWPNDRWANNRWTRW